MQREERVEHEVDHITPRAHEGATAAANLCLACASCNGSKQARVDGIDSQTGERITLFHPRQQRWQEHFAWNADGTRILGITPCGRVTVEVLKLNNPLITVARSVWVNAGLHPPKLRSEAR
ncbi:MAG: HNH endonuclease [Caldilineaceae bacterium]